MAAFDDDGTEPSRYERMVLMDEPWGPSAYLHESTGWYPITFSTDATCSATNIDYAYTTSSTAVVVLSGSDVTANNIMPEKLWEELKQWAPLDGDEYECGEDPLAALKQRHRELSWRHIREAQVARRKAVDGPRPRVPLQSRQHPYVRPVTKKRVCAGSSRYRVRVN